MPVHAQSTNPLQRLRSAVSKRAAKVDRPAWRRFFLALFALAFALFLALYGTALSRAGRYTLAAAMAAISLLLTGLVAIRVVPYLARRTALRHWMTKAEYEFTREGAVYLAVISVIAVAALNTGNNLLFIILSCLLAGFIASGVLSGIVLHALELELGLPDHVFAEQPAAARLRVSNHKRFLPTFSLTISGRGSSRRMRRRQATPMKSVILTQAVYVPYIPARNSASYDVALTFPARGRYSQESFQITTGFPFGLLCKTRRVPCGRDILVLPNVHASRKFTDVLPLIGNEIDSCLKGRSHDLYAIRDYQESDSARHVDWKASARVQQLKVREFTREDERRLELVFDPRIPDGRPQTLERFEKAVTLCACLAWRLCELAAEMRFITAGFETLSLPAQEVLFPVLERLALIEPAVTDDYLAKCFYADSSVPTQSFKIVITHQPQESIPGSLRRSSCFVFMDSL